MAIYLGANQLDSSGGGGGLPETQIFTADGTWTVPQSVLDEITAEGHAEASLFIVGGGAVSASGSSGEIVSGLRQINGADYDPVALNVTSGASIGDTTISISAAPKNMVGGVFADGSQTRNITVGASGATSITLDAALTTAVPAGELRVTHTTQANPVISVQVGDAGQNSGFTLDPETSIINYTQTTSTLNRNQTYYYSFPADVFVNSDGYPLIQSLVLGVGIFNANLSTSGFTTAPSVVSSGSYTATITWPTPTVFDGTISISGDIFGSAGTLTFRVDGSTAYDRIANRRWYIRWTNASRNASFATFQYTYQGADQYLTVARHGDSGETANFLNNASSAEGYFGGFCRSSSTRANSGSPGQAGYVQISFT